MRLEGLVGVRSYGWWGDVRRMQRRKLRNGSTPSHLVSWEGTTIMNSSEPPQHAYPNLPMSTIQEINICDQLLFRSNANVYADALCIRHPFELVGYP
jgi:hypothetical protein